MHRVASWETQNMEPSKATTWHPVTRIAFRFAFVYLVLYNLEFPLALVPGGEAVAEHYQALWGIVFSWVGKHILHLEREILTDPSGSGDRTFHYVQLLCFVTLAAAAAAVWSVLDRRRPSYERLHLWLRAYVRVSLGIIMMTYGAAKVIKAQFPNPPLDRLVQPFGDASPMGLVWRFMGYSVGYNLFTGAGEMLGGMLLFTRRTTMLGALVSIGVLGHVAVINLCYDVPVKLFSLHLLAMAIFLLVPDGGRLTDFFLFNRAAAPADLRPLFGRKWLDRGALAFRTLVFLAALGFTLHLSYQTRKAYGDDAPRSPLYGIWEVEEFELDGRVLPPLITDKDRWRRVIFDHPSMIAIQRMNDSRERYFVELDAERKTLTLSGREKPDQKDVLTYEDSEATKLQLTGQLKGRRLRARLRRTDPADFLLLSRGFHWITEYPFNR
jgi:hypothetical protein